MIISEFQMINFIQTDNLSGMKTELSKFNRNEILDYFKYTEHDWIK